MDFKIIPKEAFTVKIGKPACFYSKVTGGSIK
jgi:hypothetical protein